MYSAIVLTASPDNALQATTVKEYVEQTWGSRDSRLLLLLVRLLIKRDDTGNELDQEDCKYQTYVRLITRDLPCFTQIRPTE